MISINNRILVLVYVPILNQEYNVFIPIGKTIGTVKKAMLDVIQEFNEIEFINHIKVYNRDTSILYEDNAMIKNLKLRNGERLLLI